jgi:hypothetical protein
LDGDNGEFGNEQTEPPREVRVFVDEQLIIKAFYLNRNIVGTTEPNTGTAYHWLL